MILTTVWLVFEPGPQSTLQSICREQHWHTIGLYEQTKATMHSDQESAIEDAKARLAKGTDRRRSRPTATARRVDVRTRALVTRDGDAARL